ncbi:MAG: hypothetical protein SFT90_03150 [Rickettsiales bacterium]|nr:hypothetical protein [Rickettsiales bacterium]
MNFLTQISLQQQLQTATPAYGKAEFDAIMAEVNAIKEAIFPADENKPSVLTQAYPNITRDLLIKNTNSDVEKNIQYSSNAYLINYFFGEEYIAYLMSKADGDLTKFRGAFYKELKELEIQTDSDDSKDKFKPFGDGKPLAITNNTLPASVSGSDGTSTTLNWGFTPAYFDGSDTPEEQEALKKATFAGILKNYSLSFADSPPTFYDFQGDNNTNIWGAILQILSNIFKFDLTEFFPNKNNENEKDKKSTIEYYTSDAGKTELQGALQEKIKTITPEKIQNLIADSETPEKFLEALNKEFGNMEVDVYTGTSTNYEKVLKKVKLSDLGFKLNSDQAKPLLQVAGVLADANLKDIYTNLDLTSPEHYQELRKNAILQKAKVLEVVRYDVDYSDNNTSYKIKESFYTPEVSKEIATGLAQALIGVTIKNSDGNTDIVIADINGKAAVNLFTKGTLSGDSENNENLTKIWNIIKGKPIEFDVNGKRVEMSINEFARYNGLMTTGNTQGILPELFRLEPINVAMKNLTTEEIKAPVDVTKGQTSKDAGSGGGSKASVSGGASLEDAPPPPVINNNPTPAGRKTYAEHLRDLDEACNIMRNLFTDEVGSTEQSMLRYIDRKFPPQQAKDIKYLCRTIHEHFESSNSNRDPSSLPNRFILPRDMSRFNRYVDRLQNSAHRRVERASDVYAEYDLVTIQGSQKASYPGADIYLSDEDYNYMKRRNENNGNFFEKAFLPAIRANDGNFFGIDDLNKAKRERDALQNPKDSKNGLSGGISEEDASPTSGITGGVADEEDASPTSGITGGVAAEEDASPIPTNVDTETQIFLNALSTNDPAEKTALADVISALQEANVQYKATTTTNNEKAEKAFAELIKALGEGATITIGADGKASVKKGDNNVNIENLELIPFTANQTIEGVDLSAQGDQSQAYLKAVGKLSNAVNINATSNANISSVNGNNLLKLQEFAR